MSKLLIIDSEPTIRESLSIILEENGYEVDAVTGPEEGRQLISERNYDLILTDLLRPGADGFGFIKEVRQKFGRTIPIIILTAHGTVENASLAINEAVDDFIIKPFEVKTVTDAVKYALQKKDKQPSKVSLPVKADNVQNSFEKKFFGLSSLDEIGKKIKETSEIDEIGNTLFEQARKALKPSRGVLVFYYRDRFDIKYQRICLKDQLVEEKITSVDGGLLDWLKASGQAILVEDMSVDQQYQYHFNDNKEKGSVLAMPFIRQKRLLGSIVLYRSANRKPFHEDDMQYLSVLSCMAAVALENLEIYDEMKNYFTGTIRALITTVETKDAFTFGHSARVAKYALMIADKLNMNEIEKRRLEYIALLHDIGKIGIPETILKKVNPLTDEEWLILKGHPELGEKIVRSIHFLPEGANVVRHHHEFYDGGGYPDGLKGNNIPLFARIISVADAYDAMNSDRPYRNSMGVEKSIAEIIRCKGTQFDPKIAEIFIETIKATRRSA